MGSRWDTGRTEAFSDGVFAIAITLLILDIRVPDSAFEDLWPAIADQWPSYLAYATSFLTVGGLWLAHHGVFARLHAVDAVIMRINLLLLLAVSFLPFPTHLIAEAIRTTSAERAAVVFYGGALLVCSLLLAAMWRAVAARPHLLAPEVSEADVEELLRATAPDLGFYVLVTALAIFVPHVAAFGYLLIAIGLVLQARGSE